MSDDKQERMTMRLERGSARLERSGSRSSVEAARLGRAATGANTIRRVGVACWLLYTGSNLLVEYPVLQYRLCEYRMLGGGARA